MSSPPLEVIITSSNLSSLEKLKLAQEELAKLLRIEKSLLERESKILMFPFETPEEDIADT